MAWYNPVSWFKQEPPPQPSPAQAELQAIYQENEHKRRARELEALKIVNGEAGRIQALCRQRASEGYRYLQEHCKTSDIDGVIRALRRLGLDAGRVRNGDRVSAGTIEVAW
jgi:hypothetical protein